MRASTRPWTVVKASGSGPERVAESVSLQSDGFRSSGALLGRPVSVAEESHLLALEGTRHGDLTLDPLGRLHDESGVVIDPLGKILAPDRHGPHRSSPSRCSGRPVLVRVRWRGTGGARKFIDEPALEHLTGNAAISEHRDPSEPR